MARRGVVIPELAKVSGVNRATVERMYDCLKSAGLGAKDYRGRGDQHGHFDQAHLADMLIAFAAPLPADAAEAVARIRPLKSGEVCFGDFLERAIHETALIQDDRAVSHISEAAPESIRFGFTYPFAQVKWSDLAETDKKNRPELFLHPELRVRASFPDARTNGVVQETTLNNFMILAAADLWLDTMKRRDHGVATPKGAAEAPTSNSTHSDQPAPQARPVSTAKGKQSRLGVQPKPPKGTGRG